MSLPGGAFGSTFEYMCAVSVSNGTETTGVTLPDAHHTSLLLVKKMVPPKERWQ